MRRSREGESPAWSVTWRRAARSARVNDTWSGSDARGAGVEVDEVADGVVDQQDAPDLLLDPVGISRAQDRSGLELVGFDLVEDGLDLPALRVGPG